MSEIKQHIDICIASYKRPQLLARLLVSLGEQQLPEDVTIGIIVVDNDPQGTAHDAVKKASAAGMPIRYFSQPKKNIAVTRNMAAANARGEYIAYIDDDEYAEPGWLLNLYQAMQAYQADMVFGPVICEVPADAPDWLLKGDFFNWPRYKTGTVIPGRGTGNVLIRAKAMPDRNAPFDPKFGLSGGEDTDFFSRMQKSGAKLIWCDEAVARETLVPERFSANYLIRRAFRGGQTFAVIYIKPQSAFKKIPWFIYRVALVLVALIGAVFAWPMRKAWGVKCFQKVASNIGQLSSLLPYRFEEYAEK
ncbi:MAG: hypothetical protein RL020_1903 [Pseudomonadota bacterium]